MRVNVVLPEPLELSGMGKEIDERLRFEMLISDLSARFVKADPEEISEEVNRAIQQILEFFDVDEIVYGEFSEEEKGLVTVFSHSRSGNPHVPRRFNKPLPFPWYVDRLRSGKTVRLSVDSLPDAANAVEEIVFFFRSVEVGNVVRREVCDRGATFLDIENRALPKDTDLVMLDAELWSNRIQAKNEEVVKPEGRRVGTGEACVWVSADKLFGTSPIYPHQPLPSFPFYAEFVIGDWILPGGGECLMARNTIPVSSLGLVG